VGISEEERVERLRELRELWEEYPVIPVFKEEGELRWSLEHGNIDFIADGRYWRGVTPALGAPLRLRVSKVKPWPPATVGYSVRALSIDKAVALVNGVIEEEGERLIYFRVICPEIPPPRRSYVEEALEELRMIEAELLSGYVRRELHDL